ncbi:MAG: 2-phosphosulfolactate phosphatase [Angustibacter sp.]
MAIPAEPDRARIDVEWGLAGARSFADTADVVVVVDVLSFSTSVTVACERGARVWPHPGGEAAHELARSIEAELAGTRSHRGGPSLSPASLLELPRGARLVLPSPNGSSITHALMGSSALVLTGCLRNADAVARRIGQAVDEGATVVAVVPAGERWPDESLRVAYEDLVGAGAVISRLAARQPDVVLSPEASAARLAFTAMRDLADTPTGRELLDRDYPDDVRIAGEVDASTVIPELRDGSFVAI